MQRTESGREDGIKTDPQLIFSERLASGLIGPDMCVCYQSANKQG